MAHSKQWEMPEQQGFKTLEHVWIPMQDEVRLSARLWIPEHASRIPVPVVLEYIPYRKRDLYRSHDNAWGKVLASHGVAFARIDVRGTGDSEGVILDEYAPVELEDGTHCIDWLSRQPWCNGNVGMRGLSWGAINTLMIAAMQPPALKAILPIAGTDNRYTDDAHYIGGLLGQPNLSWGVLFKAVMAAPPDPAVVGDVWQAMWRDRLERTSPIITKWLRHQWFDDYWQRACIALDYKAIKCPTYVVGGWLDTYSNPVGRLLTNLQVPRKGLIGPWDHIYPEAAEPSGIDWQYEEVRWWRHWLLNEDTGIMDEPMLRAFMPYLAERQIPSSALTGRWITEQLWPPVEQQVKRMWLNSGGLEGDAQPMKEILYHPSEEPVGLTKSDWDHKFPVEQSLDDRRSLVFDSEPLEQDFELLGYPRVSLRISADQPVTSVMIRLTEVSPTGESWLVSHVLRNLTHRDGHASPKPLVPEQFYEVLLPMHMSAYRFKAGHRIRMAISDTQWPLTCPTPKRAQFTIGTGASSLELPIRPSEAQVLDAPTQQLPGSITQAPPERPTTELDDQGHYVYQDRQPQVRWTVPDTGTTMSRESTDIRRLKSDGTMTSNWQSSIRFGWQREDWHCEVEASCELTALPESFHIRETVKGYQDSQIIFERTSDEIVDRHLL